MFLDPQVGSEKRGCERRRRDIERETAFLFDGAQGGFALSQYLFGDCLREKLVCITRRVRDVCEQIAVGNRDDERQVARAQQL